MASTLSKLELSVKDYQSNEEAKVTYHGEVVSLDSATKTYLYRFFETDSGTLMVSLDFSKEDKVRVSEINDNIKMMMELVLNDYGVCSHQFDAVNVLNLKTKTLNIKINEEEVILEYDLYDPRDLEQPITRNIVKINCEGGKPC